MEVKRCSVCQVKTDIEKLLGGECTTCRQGKQEVICGVCNHKYMRAAKKCPKCTENKSPSEGGGSKYGKCTCGKEDTLFKDPLLGWICAGCAQSKRSAYGFDAFAGLRQHEKDLDGMFTKGEKRKTVAGEVTCNTCGTVYVPTRAVFQCSKCFPRPICPDCNKPFSPRQGWEKVCYPCYKAKAL